MPRLVDRGDLAPANGLLSIGDQLPLLLGPAAAGAVLTVVAALLLPAVLLVVAAVLARGLNGLRSPGRSSGASANGFQLIWRTPAVRALFFLSVAYFFVYGPLEPAFPLFAKDVLGVGAAGYGALASAIGAGALVGLLFVRPLSRLRPGIVNACGAIAWGVALLPVVFLDELVPAIATPAGAALDSGHRRERPGHHPRRPRLPHLPVPSGGPALTAVLPCGSRHLAAGMR